jgi:murein DD-endopeptidase MepM/ murein hydrolase activator NlpD
MDTTRRHAPLGRVRPRFASASLRSRPHAYIGRAGTLLPEIYASDHADSRRAGRFRWLLSTCLAAGVGALAILVAIAGSMDMLDTDVATIEQRLRQASLSLRLPVTARSDGLRWALPKTDKLLIPETATAVKTYISDQVKQRRGNREYTLNKYYMRLAARLGPVPKKDARTVPPFNPFALYANTSPIDGGERSEAVPESSVPIKLLELNGILPSEDGQEMTAEEVAALVARWQTAEEEDASSGAELLAVRAQRMADVLPPQTTALPKTVFETEDTADEPGARAVAPVKVQRGDTLPRILARLGAQTSQVPAMLDAARSVFPDSGLQPGYEVRAMVLPVTNRPAGDLVRFSVYDEAGLHKVTVTRNGTGEYVPSATRVEERVTHVALTDDDRAQDSSVYTSFYSLAVKQGVPPDLITQVMRVHAPATDFRQRVRVGDGVELFFDLKGEDRGVGGEIGDLLATFITSGGETRKFYRFPTPGGTVDFYDAEGNTARKFLMRLPVRTRDVRLTSGFGMRMHPLLRIQKMHAGEDWATAAGTPIMAAGNGIVEEAGPKGENGIFVRIRHANGYKTGYAHMSRLADGVGPGVRVRQGQIVGYVGCTGLCSGPHVHYEVMVRNRFDSTYSHVNPGTIPIPNERQLKGKDLADFKRERTRIDELMRRSPVRSAQLPS